MRKYFGVIGAASDDEILKRGALLCDEVLCNTVTEGARQAVDRGIVRVTLSEKRSRSLADAPDELYPEAESSIRAKHREIGEALQTVAVAAAELKALIAGRAPGEVISQLPAAIDHTIAVSDAAVGELHNISTRMECELLRLGNTEDVFVPLTYGIGLPKTVLGPKAAVATITLHRLPLPGSDTPWEAIAEWKSDPEAVEKYRALRAWIVKVASDDASIGDIEEELVAQLTTYERYMAVQHKKMHRSRVEAIVLPVAGALEDIVHFRFSSAAERLFAIFKQEAVLLESELAAPGREVAFVASTNSRFRSTG